MGLNAERFARLISAQATASDSRDALLDCFCGALIEAGMPLWRVSVSTPAIDPSVSVFSMNWRSGEGVSLVRNPHGIENDATFLRSPIHALVQDGRTFARWRLAPLLPDEGFPILHELRDAGGTDYVLHMVMFTPGTALRGVAVSFATQAASGFSDSHLSDLDKVLPVFGLAICKIGLSHTLRETLATYLGPVTSGRVLDGQIRRGQGQAVAAAILLADLRAFTTLADREDPLRVVTWLDEHFDALGEPIAQAGGEILKFLGDGFLALFPVADPASLTCPVCGGALDAAEAAMAANRQLNDRRRLAALPELSVDLVLHFGEVIYGNVGTGRRLDFTVIGRAVNEASRIEKLCSELGRSLLLSDTFAARVDRQLHAVGTVKLRGLERPQRVWSTIEQDGCLDRC